MSKWSVRQNASRHWTVYDTTGDNLNEVYVYRKQDGVEVAQLLNDFEKNYNTLAETQRRLLKEVKELREYKAKNLLKVG